MKTANTTTKNKLLLIILLFAASVFIHACGKTSPDSPGSKIDEECENVLAEIGSSKICQEDFDAALAGIGKKERKNYKELSGKLKFLDSMIHKELLSQEAVRRGLDNDPQFLKRMERTKKHFLSTRLKNIIKNEEIDLPEDEIRKYYEEHRDKFIQPEAVSVRYLSFKFKRKTKSEEDKLKKENKKELMEDMREKIKSGNITFQDAITKFSNDNIGGTHSGEMTDLQKGRKGESIIGIAADKNLVTEG